MRLLFITLTALALLVAAWAAATVPAPAPMPRARQTVLDLAHRFLETTFLTPTAALAAAAPLTAAVVQPRAGRALDNKRIRGDVGLRALPTPGHSN